MGGAEAGRDVVCAGAIAAARHHVRVEQMIDDLRLKPRNDLEISTVVLGAGMASSFSQFIAERGRFLPHEQAKTRYRSKKPKIPIQKSCICSARYASMSSF